MEKEVATFKSTLASMSNPKTLFES